MKQITTLILTILSTLLLSSAQNFEQKFREYGLIDIQTIDSTIMVDLMYSTPDNFVGQDMYGTLEKAYLLPEIAEMTALAQKLLQTFNPRYTLLIKDAARPMSVQRKMFSLVAGTPLNIYVANPAKGGGRHNYGVAVDVTIIDTETGLELDMGSPVDHFGPEAHIDATTKGLISKEAAANRKLLIDTMHAAGFTVHPKEWWHFHKYTVAELKARYRALNF